MQQLHIKKNNLQNFILIMIVGSVALLIVGILFVIFGAKNINFMDIWNAFFSYDNTNTDHIIIIGLRLPRLIANIMVGSALALTGAIMQGSTKNPMADSGLMGISGGAVFAMTIMLVFFPGMSKLGMIGLSCCGAALATFMTYFIAAASRKGMTPERLVLSGMSISMLFSSLSSALILKFNMTRELAFYMAGTTSTVNWLDVQLCAPVFIIGVTVSLCISRSLTVMNLGDDVATGLGLNVKLIKTINTLVVLLLTAMAVIIIGPVSYIGLMVPHIARHLVGTDYRLVLPTSALLGAIFVVIVDFIGKIIMSPFEMPIGILLSLIGVPFFIYISRKQRREFGQ
ncbi:MAG: iron ABC transporter permease [Clostridia bacterium]